MRPPRISAPTQSPAFPWTTISPPVISAPRCIPTFPRTVSRPPFIPAPTHFTREQSPSTRTSRSEASPSTEKNSPSGTWALPCCAGSAATSAADLPARLSGVRHSASTGTVVVPRYWRRSMAASRNLGKHLLHLLGGEGAQRLGADVVEHVRGQQRGGGRLVVGGLEHADAVIGPQRPVDLLDADAELLDLRRPVGAPLGGVLHRLDALVGEVNEADVRRHGVAPFFEGMADFTPAACAGANGTAPASRRSCRRRPSAPPAGTPPAPRPASPPRLPAGPARR